jgi:hypothetical protein
MAILSRTKQAQQWRSARMVRFAQTQLRKREWLNFEEIVVLCSEMNGSGVPNETVRENTCRNLELGLLNGDFEENGRSRVFYLHPSTVRTRMTREWYRDAIDYNYDGYQGRSQFLPWCWISRSMYERLAAKHYLPSAPLRFSPTEGENPTWSFNKSGREPTADEAAPKDQARPQPARERARRALEALFDSGVPDAAALPNKHLAAMVNNWLKERKQPPVGQRTIQRAAGRK